MGYEKGKAFFAATSLLAAVILLSSCVFAARCFFLGAASLQRGPDAPGSSIPYEAPAKASRVGLASGPAAPSGPLSMGSPPAPPAAPAFSWASDGALVADASARYLAQGRWDALLQLSALPWRADVTDEQKLELASKSSAGHLGRALQAESLIYEPFVKGSSREGLGLARGLALVSNLRLRLKEDFLPRRVAEIMLASYVSAMPDAFARRLASSLLKQEPPEVFTSYGKPSLALLSSALTSDPGAGAFLAGCRLEELRQTLLRMGPVGSKWLASSGGAPEQRKALAELMKSGAPASLSLDFWSSLPRPFRWAAAERIWLPFDSLESAALSEGLGKSFQGLAWRETTFQELEPDARSCSWLRSFPPWQEAMDSLDYAGAFERLEKAHLEITGRPLDEALAARLRRMQAVERSLWGELVDKAAWEKAAAAGLASSPESFVAALKGALPGWRQRALKDCALVAACMINRGEDPRYVNIEFNIAVKDLSRYIPEKEFANERKSGE